MAPIPYRIEPDIAGLVHEQVNSPARQSGQTPVVTMSARAIQRYQIEAYVDGHRYLTDEPVKGGGHDTAPAPLRYFVGAVLQCTLIWCTKVAAADGVPIAELTATAEAYLEPGVVGVLREDGPLADGRGFDRMRLVVALTTDSATSNEMAAAVVGKGIRACPAAVAFSRGAALEVSVVHNGTVLA